MFSVTVLTLFLQLGHKSSHIETTKQLYYLEAYISDIENDIFDSEQFFAKYSACLFFD